MCTPAPSAPQGFEDIHKDLLGIETISMNNVEILPTDVITDSLLPLPKIPDFPDVPEVTDFPDAPEIPDFPDVPEIPDFPDVPEIPDFSDVPEIPDFSDIPEIPDFSDIPEIPDIPDIPENVIVVPASPLPTTSEFLSYSIGHKTTTVTGPNTQLTYVTHGNVSLRSQPNTESASNATSTTINVPTAKEAPFKQPILVPVRRLRPVESGPSAPKKQKIDETVFLTPLPVTVHAGPLTRITKNIPKPKTTDSDPNKLIKALLARKSTPYLTRVSAPRTRNFNVGASTQTHTGKTKILKLPVSASLPVPLANLVAGTPVRPLHGQNAGLLTQRPILRSAFVKTTTAADFIPRSSTVGTVITTHVTTTTAITTPMTVEPQLSYAISPIRVATTVGTTATTTDTRSTGQSLVRVSSPSPQALLQTQSKTYVPVQHLYKAQPDAAAVVKKILKLNLVGNKDLPGLFNATVTTPAPITMLGSQGSITTSVGVASSLQRPSANTHAKTHNYKYLEPGEIKQIEKVPPRTFPGPRSTCVGQRQASAAAVMQQQATIISKTKAAKHAEHYAESQARSELEIGSEREVQHASSLAALQEASHAHLVAASEDVRVKLRQQTLFQDKIKNSSVEAQKSPVTSPAATKAQALSAPLQLPVTTQLQIAALGPTQTVSLAQPHGSLNVQLFTPAQAQLLSDAKAKLHITSQSQIHGIPQTQRIAYSQAQGEPLTAYRPQDESLANSQLQGQSWTTSNLQSQPLATSQQPPHSTSNVELFTPAQEQLHTTSLSQILRIPQTERVAYSQTQGRPLAASRPQDESLANFQLQGQSWTTSNLQSQSLATSQQLAHGNLNVQLLTSAQAQLHATPQGQTHGIPQTQRIAFSQMQGQPLAASRTQDDSLEHSQLQGQSWTTSHLQGQMLATSQQPDQLLASPKPQGHHLATTLAPTYILATSKTQDHHLPISLDSTYILATSQAQILTTSQSQGPIYITSQRKAPRLAKSQSQGPILVAPQRHALLATPQSQGRLLATLQAKSRAILPTQANVTPPVQIKSTQANATLIAQLNAPPQKIVPRGQQNVPRLQLHTTPDQLKNITERQLNTVTLAQLKTSQWRQQATSPTQIQMSSPPQPNASHDQPGPRIRRRLIIRTANPALPLDKTPVIQSAANETVAASTSLNEQHPGTSSVSRQIGDVPSSSSIHTTSTLTLSTGTTLVMPHYKTTVFKNLSSIGRTEPTRLPTPRTTSGERMVIRRPVTFFPARRTFPTTTQSSTATTITTSTTTATTTPLIHIIRTVPRHMLGSLDTGNTRVRPDGPRTEVLTHIITPPKPKTEEE